MNGSADPVIRWVVERIMREAKAKIDERTPEPRLTVGQYNCVYSAVQEVLEEVKGW
jgi:hypothetical protein